MKLTKIHDLLPFKRVDFGPKIILGKLKKLMFWGQGPWTVDIEIAQKWSIGTPSQKLGIFQILRFLTKYHGLKLMKMTKIYDF